MFFLTTKIRKENPSENQFQKGDIQVVFFFLPQIKPIIQTKAAGADPPPEGISFSIQRIALADRSLEIIVLGKERPKPAIFHGQTKSCLLYTSGKSFKIIPDDENSEEFVNFYFIGMYEGKAVVYDAALYTLRLHHSSEVYELAEHKAAQKFTNFHGISYEEDENGNMKPLTQEEEEVGWFITEIIMEIEEEESVKVQEFVDIDTHHDFGIGLDAALNVESIDEQVISKFIKEFNDDTLILDDTMYAFQSEEGDFEED